MSCHNVAGQQKTSCNYISKETHLYILPEYFLTFWCINVAELISVDVIDIVKCSPKFIVVLRKKVLRKLMAIPNKGNLCMTKVSRGQMWSQNNYMTCDIKRGTDMKLNSYSESAKSN